MKVLSLTIKNIGIIADTTIEFNKPLCLFYGEVMAGKSTILNSVKWCFGGAFPADIIRHGQEAASIILTLDNGSITREWYKGRDGVTKARDIVFIQDSKPVKRPVQAIALLTNPFLLNQDFLRDMTELERNRYFIDFLGVDTKEQDAENDDLTEQARSLRSKIDGYGAIDLTEIKPADVTALRTKLDGIKTEHAEKVKGWRAEIKKRQDAYQTDLQTSTKINADVDKHNATVERGQTTLTELAAEITRLESTLATARKKQTETAKWLQANPRKSTHTLPGAPDLSKIQKQIDTDPDTADLEKQISEAAANNVRREQYLANVARAEQKKKDQGLLVAAETRQREIKAEKIAKLAEIATGSKIAGLAFGEDGGFTYEGTTAGMLSTSQLMRLSSDLSALYPSGLGIELVDRAESLGKSIFEYVDRAKAEEKTILAAIVGERPATVPENIGVFVVEKGEVKS